MNKPEVLIVPPMAAQVTAVLDDPVTVAVKVFVVSWLTVAVVGLMVMPTAAAIGKAREEQTKPRNNARIERIDHLTAGYCKSNKAELVKAGR